MKIIGIALSDEYTDISLVKEEYTYRFPTLLSRERQENRFYIGEEAYKKNLDGGVILVDKLLSLLRKREVLLWQRNVMMPENFWLYF